MKILHIICSPRGAESLSLRFSQRIVARLVARHRRAEVTTRDLGAAPLPHADEDYGHVLAGSRPPPADAQAREGSLSRSDQLIAELERADTLVIGTPMHNYTVPSVLKAWLDHVLRVHRTFRLTPEGKKGLLADRPVYVAVAAGGSYTGADARQPDFLTPYLQAALGTIGLHDLRFFPLQRMVGGELRVDEALRDAQTLLERHLPAGLPA